MTRRKLVAEQEWLDCAEPAQLLGFLRRRVSERKRRLFAAACCRRVWPLLPDERSRLGVETAERYADGAATAEELSRAEEEAQEAHEAEMDAGRDAPVAAADAVYVTVCEEAKWDLAECASRSAADAVAAAAGRGKRASRLGELAAQVQLLRCIFGNPFRPLAFEAAWRAWNGGTIPALAQTIYDNRDLPSGHLDAGRLGILADALEDAGCADPATLGHLRSQGPHVRGCFVVDSCLGLT
jgi:hypothetical protein